MRYCPNISCPHRQRIGAPAEFLDHVIRCSDCDTRLIASEEDAIEGCQPGAAVPYRALAEVPREEVREAPQRRANERALGTLFVGMGLALSMITYVLASNGTGVIHLIAWCAVAYGGLRVLSRRR